jgi:hypothetical protein
LPQRAERLAHGTECLRPLGGCDCRLEGGRGLVPAGLGVPCIDEAKPARGSGFGCLDGCVGTRKAGRGCEKGNSEYGSAKDDDLRAVDGDA